MSAEMRFEGIPEKFQPLFMGSARDVLRAAQDLIVSADIDGQRKLLGDNLFCKAVNSALFNLDQRRKRHAVIVIGTFDKKAQPEAQKIFLGESLN